MSFNRAGKAKQTATSLNRPVLRTGEGEPYKGITLNRTNLELNSKGLSNFLGSSRPASKERRRPHGFQMLSEPHLDRLPAKNPKIIQYSLKYQQGIADCSAG
jgi:hypothetical protein